MSRTGGFKRRWKWILASVPLAMMMLLCVFLLFCGNNPWPREYTEGNSLFVVASGEYKTLDPALSYFEHESVIIDNIVESLFCYEYGTRPYKLIPMLAEAIPEEIYVDKDGRRLADASQGFASVEYDIHLKKGVLYQPHPCFAKNADGSLRYSSGELPKCKSPLDFPELATREMTAEDFKVSLVRLCDPKHPSPVYSNFKSFLLGMDECSKYLAEHPDADYRKVPLAGFVQTGTHSFTLRLSRRYPQALYWMAMHFFSPMPYEALEFYKRPELADSGINLGHWPVGTGAYMLAVNETDSKFILKKNPNFRKEEYQNQRLPLTDMLCFMFENETLPSWIKFLQGYFDLHAIPQETFDSAMSVGGDGALDLSDNMKAQGISLVSSVRLVTYYYAFNMLDDVFGGNSPEKKKLRQAISIVVDSGEYINLFVNGRAKVAQGILPIGILGSEATRDNYNSFVFEWDEKADAPKRRSVEYARKLMAEAGYPNGIGPDGKRLQLNYDHASAGRAGFVAQFRWLKSKLELIGIELVDRGTDQNRMRDKMVNGNWQLTRKAWVADYPDAENFLFLYHSKNAHALNQGRGANYTNYTSDAYDAVFQKLETMSDGEERLKFIKQANRIIWEDAPCIWEYYPTSFTLKHDWLENHTPMEIGNSYMKYYRINTAKRKLEISSGTTGTSGTKFPM